IAFTGAVTPATASPSAQCKLRTDPFHAPAASLAQCGIRAFPLNGVIRNSDGSTSYEYDVYGHRTESHVPPVVSDPITAAASQLARYGLPKNPATVNVPQFKTWLGLISKVHFVAPPRALISVPIRSTPRHGTPNQGRKRRSPSGNVFESENWSGMDKSP